MIIAIVVTNYNNSDLTIDLVNSLPKKVDNTKFHVIVVDNKSDKKEIEKLNKGTSNLGHVKCIYNIENKGYFRGLNDGISYIYNNNINFDILIVGNNDLKFFPDFFSSFDKITNVVNNYSVICPRITTIDGVEQNPHVAYPISKFRRILWDIYYSNFYVSKLMSFFSNLTKRWTSRSDHVDFEEGREIYEGYGACYILTKKFFLYYKYLWSPTFLMGEEFFLSKQLQAVGEKMYYSPELRVLHKDHASVAKLPSKDFWNISRQSHKIYKDFANHFGHHGEEKDIEVIDKNFILKY